MADVSRDDSRSYEKSGVSRRAIILASSAAAAGIASQKMGETRAIATHAGVEVSHGHSVGYNWNIPKDSPNGNKVLYVRYPGGNPLPGEPNYPAGPAEIWYASPTGTSRTKIVGGILANNHTGLNQLWIDNQRIAFRHQTATKKHTKVMNVNGTVVRNWSGLQGVIPLDYSPAIGKIVAGRQVGQGAALADVWLLDPDTGATNKIFDTSDLMPWQSLMGGSPTDWRLWHRYINPAGTLIWIKIEAPNGSFGFTFNTSGGNIIRFNSHPGHATWWDNTRILTNRPGGLIAIRNRNGSLVQDNVAGKTNHVSISPDRTLICSDYFWWSSGNRIKVRLYQKGSTTPLHLIFGTPYEEIVDNPSLPHAAMAHPNMSFSRNGQRLYVVKPVAVNSTRLMMYDISQWA